MYFDSSYTIIFYDWLSTFVENLIIRKLLNKDFACTQTCVSEKVDLFFSFLRRIQLSAVMVMIAAIWKEVTLLAIWGTLFLDFLLLVCFLLCDAQVCWEFWFHHRSKDCRILLFASESVSHASHLFSYWLLGVFRRDAQT